MPTLKVLGALAEDVMGKALSGLDENVDPPVPDGLARIKANLKNELHLGACDK